MCMRTWETTHGNCLYIIKQSTLIVKEHLICNTFHTVSLSKLIANIQHLEDFFFKPLSQNLWQMFWLQLTLSKSNSQTSYNRPSHRFTKNLHYPSSILSTLHKVEVSHSQSFYVSVQNRIWLYAVFWLYLIFNTNRQAVTSLSLNTPSAMTKTNS